ncbi:Thiol-disulfide oxidoreductase ResA [Meiothermus taiwanensis]|jgi:thiol-disulfide isomerase/thioredoxin|uniref:Thiol-disulfide oxidoreductase ResA n=2 Tax=Meiothermus taiwanensis TaxID=172827 RepID=A0A399DZX5_9DEIN|nr:redoxin [Meiothermus taiwanensis]KZK15074.1 redoxin [Meiothermus taiwanensis]RIH75571.1 Thiol-disulfide oxidoreductase ResA [Meiothermus taiwanensis]
MLIWMRRWIWLVLPLIGLVGWLLLQPKPSPAVEVLPSATLQQLDGPAVQLADFKGKPIVLNAWATWCGPCRREMPLLVEAARAHPEIQFIFLNISDGPEAVRAFQRELKLQIPNVLLDPEATLSDPLRIQGLPVTLFYNAEGTLVNRHIGEIKAETLEALLKAL